MYGCANWISVRHRGQIRRNRLRAPFDKVPYPTGQKSVLAFPGPPRRVDEHTRYRERAARVRLPHRCRESCAPGVAPGIALPVPPEPTAALLAWPDRWRLSQPNAWTRGRQSREATLIA